MNKVCAKCQEYLPIELFSRQIKLGGKYVYSHSYCKKCRNNMERTRRIIKREEIKIKDAIRVRVIRPAKKRKRLILGITQDQIDEYRRKRENPSPKRPQHVSVMIAHLRGRIKNAIILKYNGTCLKFLGCTAEDARDHIQSLFYGGMSWENHGEYWHIDHHVPLAHFNLSDEQQCLIAFNWRNLRPLTVADNLKKSAKLPDDYEQIISCIKYHIDLESS